MSWASEIYLHAQARLDNRWLTINLQDVFVREGLSRLWNDLVCNGELISGAAKDVINAAGVLAKKGESGLYFCGSATSGCTEDTCQPDYGCNCAPCQYLDHADQEEKEKEFKRTKIATSMIDSWTWDSQPDINQLKDCLEALLYEHHQFSVGATSTTLSSVKLLQRLVILERYLIALSRHSQNEGKAPLRKKQADQTNLNKQKGSAKPTEKATHGLARVGSRAALSFAFAFLYRAWRSGEDSDLCSELLQESLDALRSLPEATLFDESSVSPVWLEVVERASKFLHSVVAGELTGGGGMTSTASSSVTSSRYTNHVPLPDQQRALALLLELAVQRGSLSHILGGVLLLLNLWENSWHERDNRVNSNLTSAPLVPLLKRFFGIQSNKAKNYEMTKWDEQADVYFVSPTECFLRYITDLGDENAPVDLQQCAVVIMSHLDRLTAPYLPPASSNKNIEFEDILGWAPTIPQINSQLHSNNDGDCIKQIQCSSRMFLALTKSGKVYSFSYSSEIQTPKLIEGFGQREVIKIASCPEGSHYMALTCDGKVFSWGFGEGGRLGHGDNISYEEPNLISALVGHHVTHISCGSSTSAAVTSHGELYTWGKGSYGHLGHGSCDDMSLPTLVLSLKSYRIVDVACSFGEGQAIALSDTGIVFTWGDKDSDKSGRSSNESRIPKPVEPLTENIVRVFCGSQFCLALSRLGVVYSWGKGNFYKLGHGSEENVRYPKPIEGLTGNVVIDIAVSSVRCLALTDESKVYGWGRSECLQAGESFITLTEPTIIQAFEGKKIVSIACNQTQSFACSATPQWVVGMKMPFVVDVCKSTFEQIDELLSQVCEDMDGRNDWPPPQEKECIAVSALNLLNLQLHTAICQNENTECLGLQPGSPVVNSLKQRVVVLASTSGIINSIQMAAQAALQIGWSILLPTADERARALSNLLSTKSRDATTQNEGQRFMTDLLVNSLMADGGLEIALQAAVKKEAQEIEKKEKISEEDLEREVEAKKVGEATNALKTERAVLEAQAQQWQDEGATGIPLLQLIQQLLKNFTSQTHSMLQRIAEETISKYDYVEVPDNSTPLKLLLQFQRLLVSKLFPFEEKYGKATSPEIEADMLSAGSVLRKYMNQLCCHVADVLPVAACLASHSSKHFSFISKIISQDVTGVLLPEIVTSLVLLQLKNPAVLQSSKVIVVLDGILDILDKFNRLAPGLEWDDKDDLLWPGFCQHSLEKFSPKTSCDIPVIRKADLENHNKDDGLWIVHNKKVYDLLGYKAQILPEKDVLVDISVRDPASVFLSGIQADVTDKLQPFLVGNYVDPEEDIIQTADTSTASSPLIDTERTLGLLLGLHAGYQAHSTNLSAEEEEFSHWLQSEFFAGGLQILQPQNPFEEEKGESKTSSSCTTTPGTTPSSEENSPFQQDKERLFDRQASQADAARPFLQALAEGKLQDPSVKAILSLIERYSKQQHNNIRIEFPPDHPVEEVSRLFLSVLLKHHDLGHVALNLIDHVNEDSCAKIVLPRAMVELVKIVGQARWSLIKAHQDQGQSYKEVCAPVIERCHFLFNELRPAIDNEISVLSRSKILKTMPRWKNIIQKMMDSKKKLKKVPDFKEDKDIEKLQQQLTGVALSDSSHDRTDEDPDDENEVKVFGKDQAKVGELTETLFTSVESEIERVCRQTVMHRYDVHRQNNDFDGGKLKQTSEKKMEFIEGDFLQSDAFPVTNPHLFPSKPDNWSHVVNAVLSNDKFRWLKQRLTGSKPEYALMNKIFEFIMWEHPIDIEKLRCSLHHQVERAKLRLKGIQNMLILTHKEHLIPSIKYSILCGWLGLLSLRNKVCEPVPHCLANINLIPPCDKILLEMTFSDLYKWAVKELRNILLQVEATLKARNLNSSRSIQDNSKECLSIGCLPQSRFLLACIGILMSQHQPNSLSMLLNSGLLGLSQSILRLTGRDPNGPIPDNSSVMCAVLEEHKAKKQTPPVPISGPELAAMMKTGTRVVRGADWKWGEQDGPHPSVGRVICELGEDGWIRVQWDTGSTNSYRMGKEGMYDLKLAQPPQMPDNDEDDEEEVDTGEPSQQKSRHPTAFIRQGTISLLRVLCLCASINAENMQKESISNLCGLICTIVHQTVHNTPGNNATLKRVCEEQHFSWCTLGFIRSIASSPTICQALSTPRWIVLLFKLLSSDQSSDVPKNVVRQILALRLLKGVLPSWDSSLEASRMKDIVEKMFSLLGNVLLSCSSDPTLLPPSDTLRKGHRGRPPVTITASYSSTVADEIVSTIRKLHLLDGWNAHINSYIISKLGMIEDMVCDKSKSSMDDLNIDLQETHAAIMAVLAVIGGIGLLPRLGGLVMHYELRLGTIANIRPSGKIQVQFPEVGLKMCRMTDLVPVPHLEFVVDKLPMTENVINTWVKLVSLAGTGFKVEKERERTSLFSSVNSVESTGTNTDKKNFGCGLNTKLLHKQQIRLGLLKAARVLFSRQDNLHKVLSQPAVLDLGFASSLETGVGFSSSTEEDLNTLQQEPATNISLLQHLMVAATQPSPLKAIFSREEMEAAAMAVCQYLTAVSGQPQDVFDSSSDSEDIVPYLVNSASVSQVSPNRTPKSKRVRQSSLQQPLPPVVFQLQEMGFPRKNVEHAIKALGGSLLAGCDTPSAESLVGWLLEHKDLKIQSDSDSDMSVCSIDIDSDETGSMSDIFDDLDDDDIELEEQEITTTTYKKPSDFANIDEYAMYVQINIVPGMTVRCCCTYEEVMEGDIGKVIKLDHDGLHHLNVQAYWQRKGGTYWMRYIHIELLGFTDVPSSCQTIKVGDRVRVKPSVSLPMYKWGSVTHRSVGVVTAIHANGRDISIDYPQQAHWTGVIEEMELVPSTHPGILCNGCQMNPITGSRFECRVCKKFDFCENCFKTKRNHKHPFNGIPEPGCEPIDVGKPGKQKQVSSVGNGSLIDNWHMCVKNLTVSSRENQASRLIDEGNGYWQSAGSQGKHWICLEMYQDILVSRLQMKVEPTDSSYMPSLVVVSGGDSVHTLKELRTINISVSFTWVTLLEDMTVYYRFIEIAIKQCRSSGIDCKVHGLTIVGRRKIDEDDSAANFAFLASDDEDEQSSSLQGCRKKTRSSSFSEIQTHVCVWGLNDKDQLGGPKGSKIKLPYLNETLSALKCVQIAGGSKSLFCVTQEGKVYVCGEATNGRLGLGVTCGSVPTPTLVGALSQYVIKKVAVHSGGRHALALTVDGKVFSWGEGDDGKLGHGNRSRCNRLRLVLALKSKRVRDIACGSSHSAAIISNGDLYTWGLGEYGRLGHGDTTTQLKPKQVMALVGQRVKQVACGSRDAQTLALTDEGLVYSWGDGDFGKLGRGGSEGCSVPHVIDRLTNLNVCQIECGAQFSLALTKSGGVWTWGKGDYFRLGHGTDTHIRKPKCVEGLKGKKIVHVAVGALHCLAVTDTGQVYAWGDNDHGQQGNGTTTVNRKPALVHGLESFKITKVACGSSHSIAWATTDLAAPTTHEPVLFSASRDPLGSTLLGLNEGVNDEITSSVIPATTTKPKRPSLSKIILSLESDASKQQALNHILTALQIKYARDAIVGSLMKEVQAVNPSSCLENQRSAQFHQSSPVMLASIGTTEELAPTVHSTPTIAALSERDSTAMVDSSHSDTFCPGEISSFPSMHSLAAKVSPATSIIAETFTSPDQVTSTLEIIKPAYPEGLDEFTSKLTADDARVLVDLLKLAVANRAGEKGKDTLAGILKAVDKAYPQVAEMLLELCVTELEDVAADTESGRTLPQPVVQESPHHYSDDLSLSGHVKIPGAECLRVEFDRLCSTERRHDPLTIMDGSGRTVSVRSGREWSDWSTELRIPGDELRWKFTSDGSVNGWGWRFTVYPIMPTAAPMDMLTDRTVLSQPSIDLVICLLDLELDASSDCSIVPRLAAALAACAQLSSLGAQQRMWALQKLRKIMAVNYGVNLNVNTLISSPTTDSPDQETSRTPTMSLSGTALASLVKGLPEALQRQYEYEDPIVRSGKHLMHSPFFKVLVALACDLGLDSLQCCVEAHKWAWFRRYCAAARVSTAIVNRSVLPPSFTEDVMKKIEDISAEGEVVTRDHENHEIFKQEHDEQLLLWLNRRPDDWTLSWGGSGQILGWGHNHRGQLGGVDGPKVKLPVSCETLATLRPVQLIGGEQTLFAVTANGKVYGTGYGAGGRLGTGGTESVATPTLLEYIQHAFIKKLAVNSGGKHCLALSAEGEVFTWGEGEDGKLGHGIKIPCDRPRMVEALRGKEVIDIAAGGAHSACITASGELYTWGKGRYGRLGHGDSDDQTKPKLVEVLKDYRVIDVACGSGDAQTLCITDDDSVWSWGDGDYGKLGRGGSDGCKVPIKIESLQSLGVIKVECGSQFSVALTQSGAVYTWGKGDYHRLGHGTDDHVRKPRRVSALQGKKVIDIACGSLHCVACTDTGEVYTWGDNDEGQLGDGTTNAIQRPRLVTALQGTKINRVACGSAHSLAWSTNKPISAGKLPSVIPLEYNHLQSIEIPVLRNRLVLLHHFSDLFCPSIPMFDLQEGGSECSRGEVLTNLNALRGVLVSASKEASFRKVVQATAVRDRQHGPVVELNRIQVKRSRSRGGLAGPDGTKSVFGQMAAKMSVFGPDSLMLPHRVWKVKFVGESVDDCGGGYSESIAEMCDELQNGSLSLLIVTPNGRDESGANRDCFLLNPMLKSPLHQNMFRYLGMLMGIAIRTGSPLSLNIAEPVWKQLAGMPLTISDLTEVDKDFVPGLMCIKEMLNADLRNADMPFSVPSASGQEMQLSMKYRITPENRSEYIKSAMNYRLHEFDDQIRWVREGMAKVIPVPLLSLFTGFELETMVCGSPDIPLTLLKSVATYKGIDATAPLIQWFWAVMEEFTNTERSLFLRFVWGRTRLPRTIADFRGRDFVLQVLDKYNPPDHFLPESYTCFFLLKMPRYSSQEILKEKLKYAIHFCKSIDTDDYARVALTGDLMDDDSHDASEESDDLDSIESGEFVDSD
ncbi:E3 ubiquitin-protein ligase HERC2 isoform X3 [Octopus bimaculoides]|uniref:E3 ubiquitin-protein ligase HERC2 isoform X3 n=1 Tax=Octopus bimaculoides TaxID=37653 RepID=UPI0022E2494A|nr:E3 ubiquitin-protein ligase HERC2 isoform X3 [Octopus bimaculoides]